MNFDCLRILSQKNEVPIDNYNGNSTTPPHYYHSLRHAFESYFRTFHTQNSSYDFYAQGLSGRNTDILKHQLLDVDNTVLSIIGFERFFELFFKDLLKKVNSKLVYVSRRQLRGEDRVLKLINLIDAGTFEAKKFKNRNLSVPFRESLDRYYGLIKLVKAGNTSPIVIKFGKQLKKYSFLDSSDHEGSMRLLNWYRDRILHNGNRLPTLWMFDYLITQRFVPIISEILKTEKNKGGASMFYLTTVKGLNILETLNAISFEFKDLKNPDKSKEMFKLLLYIGHLKELGRANLNMNLFVRGNHQAGYEYNYKDPIGRGIRFAEAEKRGHPDFKKIANCPCCGEKSMVIYKLIMDDIFNPGENLIIEWVKCYTCDYHLRYNVGDPMFFDLNSELIFDVD